MKRTICIMCISVVLLMLMCTVAMSETVDYALKNVDPFCFARNRGLFGMDINYLLDGFKEGIDYDKYEFDDSIEYVLNEPLSYMNLQEGDISS